MKKILAIYIISILMLSTIGVAIEEPAISIKSKILGLDTNLNKRKAVVEITTDTLGRLTYIEEYYAIDSEGKPKLHSTHRHYDGNKTDKVLYINISRPETRLGVPYSLVKSIVIINDVRIEKWLNSTSSMARKIEYIDNNKSSIEQNIATESTKLPQEVGMSNNISNNNEDRKKDREKDRKEDRKYSPLYGSTIFIVLAIFTFYVLRNMKKK